MVGGSREDASLNIGHPSRLICKSFDYTFAGNAVQLIVPNKGVSVSKLMNGSEEVWTAEEEEAFDHARVYLNKDKKPELVLLVTTSSGASKETYFELKDGKWVSCNDKDAKMLSLVVITQWKSDFEIDLSASKDTDKCTIFEEELLGITTNSYFPKPGHNIIEVKDGNNNLWIPSEPLGACLFCLVYKKGDKELLEVAVIEASLRRWKFFEKTANGEWNEIGSEPFIEKVEEMRKSGLLTTPTQGSPNPTPQPS